LDKWCFIIATGPSFQRRDAEALRNVGTGIAVNCGIFFAPWCTHLFGADSVWWRYYEPKITWYKGARISRTHKAAGVTTWRGKGWPRTGGNSGHMAIQYAVDLGFKHLALLGFDQQKTEGKAHCHADHPRMAKDGKRTNMANAGGIAAWPRLMTRTSLDLNQRGVRVVNLSRATALKCFERLTIAQFFKLLKE
jgi:hypothetical protein